MTNETNNRISTWNLILGPAVVSLAITLLRLYGELHRWPKPWFNNSAGGGFAVVGISWLPFIFGPYFALKLAKAGDRPSGNLKTVLMGFLGLVMVMGGAIVGFMPPLGPIKFAIGLIAMVLGTLLQFYTWPSLARVLLAYAYLARIPVALVMLAAIYGHWGTHYDVLPPGYAGPTSFLGEWVFIGAIPQLILWIGFTTTVGIFAGGIAAAVSRRTLSVAPDDFSVETRGAQR